MALGLVFLIAFDGFLVFKAVQYKRQIGEDRAAMTTTDKQRADALLASQSSRADLEQALVAQQAVKDKGLNLSIGLEEGTMDLQREGAQLRELRVKIGPEVTVGQAPGARKITPPLGRRQVVAVVDESYAWDVPSWVWTQRGQPAATGRRVPGALGEIAVHPRRRQRHLFAPEGGAARRRFLRPARQRARRRRRSAGHPSQPQRGHPGVFPLMTTPDPDPSTRPPFSTRVVRFFGHGGGVAFYLIARDAAGDRGQHARSSPTPHPCACSATSGGRCWRTTRTSWKA